MDIEFLRNCSFTRALSGLIDINPNIKVFSYRPVLDIKTDLFSMNGSKIKDNITDAFVHILKDALECSLIGKIPFIITFTTIISLVKELINEIDCSGGNIKIVAINDSKNQSDIDVMCSLPNMIILSPADYNQTKQVLYAASNSVGPMYIRLSQENVPCFIDPCKIFVIGESQILVKGSDVVVIATSSLVSKAIDSSILLQDEGISCEIINMPTIKPLNAKNILALSAEFRRIIIAEDHKGIGSIYNFVKETLSNNNHIYISSIHHCKNSCCSNQEHLLSVECITRAIKKSLKICS